MTDDEIIDLLTAAAAYDRRTVGEGDVLAWLEVAREGRWTFPEALAAIHTHFAHSTAWLMPAHVTELIRQERRQPPRHNRLALRGGPLPATDQTRTAAMAEIRRVLARPDGLPHAVQDLTAGSGR